MSIKAKPAFSLADQLFNKDTVAKFVRAIGEVHPEFRGQSYQKKILAEFPRLELKARISCMVDHLDWYLADDFTRSLDILEKALPPMLDPQLSDDDFGEFIWSVPSEYAAKHGCTADRLGRSLAFLKSATKRFSVESAIRPFLRDFPEETLNFVHECSVDDNYHVRRLASEGIRPYLPWALRVRVAPESIVQVLNKLHADPTRYVTRSVANTLNDLSKDDPDIVISTLQAWSALGEQNDHELQWMTRHALRTLVKTDNVAALSMLGYPAGPAFKLSGIDVPSQVRVGQVLPWQATLTSQQSQKLRIALRVHFLKANGTHSPRVFAVKDVTMAKGEKLVINKSLPFRPITTRALYTGQHYVELVVNGVARGKKSFEVLV